jgi:hypothetical protein
MIQGFSDRDRIRTYDRLLRRQMLYPAELRDRYVLIAVSEELWPFRLEIGMLYPAELRDRYVLVAFSEELWPFRLEIGMR